MLDTGDPNERVCNPKSYTDLGNGIVRDNVTGLEWVQDGNLIASRDPSFDNDSDTDDGAVTWQHALDYVDLLKTDGFLGHSDWRLPTILKSFQPLWMPAGHPAIDPVFSGTAGIRLLVVYCALHLLSAIVDCWFLRWHYELQR